MTGVKHELYGTKSDIISLMDWFVFELVVTTKPFSISLFISRVLISIF